MAKMLSIHPDLWLENHSCIQIKMARIAASPSSRPSLPSRFLCSFLWPCKEQLSQDVQKRESHLPFWNKPSWMEAKNSKIQYILNPGVILECNMVQLCSSILFIGGGTDSWGRQKKHDRSSSGNLTKSSSCPAGWSLERPPRELRFKLECAAKWIKSNQKETYSKTGRNSDVEHGS